MSLTLILFFLPSFYYSPTLSVALWLSLGQYLIHYHSLSLCHVSVIRFIGLINSSTFILPDLQALYGRKRSSSSPLVPLSHSSSHSCPGFFIWCYLGDPSICVYLKRTSVTLGCKRWEERDKGEIKDE